MEYFKIKNNESAALDQIPVTSFASFNLSAHNLLQSESCHCVSYFAFPFKDKLKFICAIADDAASDIYLFSFEISAHGERELVSLNKETPALHCFEREIHELYNVKFAGHPWLKPLRYPFNRENKKNKIVNYPFFRIEGKDVHEVSVGPIHGGIIEPGYFRFMCLGENVLHLETQLGYQHRGVEQLFLTKKKLLQRTVLAESIAGDTVVGHSLAFVRNMETLLGLGESVRTSLLRTLALELERIAMHVGILGSMCEDVAYQLGSNVFGGLRTPVINYIQSWCGNRLAKGILRAGFNPWPFTEELSTRLRETLNTFEKRYSEMADLTFILPSLLTRFQNCGEVTQEQARLTGAIGLVARCSGLKRDIRTSHPFGYFNELKYEPDLLESGDVWARGRMRDLEIRKSVSYIRVLLDLLDMYKEENHERPDTDKPLQPDRFAISLTEGWRGEICHCAVTDGNGELMVYKVKDPSMHNWFALTLALRDNEISDFPINNKSFSLSYCGHDL